MAATQSATLKARQAVAKAAKEVCEGKTGAKTKLAKAKKKALDVAKASIEKLAKTSCATKKAKAKPKAKSTASKTTKRKKTTATRKR